MALPLLREPQPDRPYVAASLWDALPADASQGPDADRLADDAARPGDAGRGDPAARPDPASPAAGPARPESRARVAPASPSELAAWLRLAFTRGLSLSAQRALLTRYGLPDAVFAAPYAELAAALGAPLAAALLEPPRPDTDREQAVQVSLAWAQAPGHRLLTLACPEYPSRLLDLHDPPPLLWVDGDPAALSRPMLAVIGARHGTPAGLDRARAFAAALGEAGWTIVSGLAAGIDAAAHDGALTTAAGTVALVGTGPDLVYPARHRSLAARIRGAGALATELPPGTPPLAHHFPRRNRLIAALAHGVLVVEAARQSGSLITARQAAELGREVFAMPGSIDSPLAKGCHDLIRQGAKLVESAQDVLEELRDALRPSAGRRPGPAKARRGQADDGGADDGRADDGGADDVPPDTGHRRAVLTALGWDPADLDQLAQRTGLPPAALLATLAELDLDGRVRRAGGGRWQRRD